MLRYLHYTLIMLVFALVPVWCRLPDAPAAYAPHYASGFLIFLPVLASIIVGIFAGHRLRWSTLKTRWALLLVLLLLWMLASTNWAFMLDKRPQVIWSGAIQFAITTLFVLTLPGNPPPATTVTFTLAALLVLHGAIGGLQVANQGSLGLFCEFPLDPQKSGVSVVLSGDLRWLRPYGLASHSNVFAGFMVVTLLATGALILAEKRWVRWIGTGAFWFGLWILGLTFSRAAWLGFMIGVGVLLALLLRQRAIRPTRHLVIALTGALVLAGLFIGLYGDLILTRAGISDEPEFTETRSIEERVLFNEIALTAIRDYPLQGVGMGNFPWYASYYLFYRTSTGMRGDNVHNIYLTIQAELGSIGTVLFLATLLYGLWAGSKTTSIHQMALIGGVVALAVIGLFDHYPWTLLHYQLLWWGVLALSFPSDYSMPALHT